MDKRERVERFEKMGLGLFVHFGLFSLLGKGEWYLSRPEADREAYAALPSRFRVRRDWAKNLVRTAQEAGAKYITLTTRHHDGFSLFDTLGLNDFDAPHSACGRDLVAEFVQACREGGILPFFYHTLLDWREPSYRTDFPAYLDYLRRSVEILCTRYGKIGGLWFDGMWDKPGEDWQEDRLYGTIRKYQPDAVIINNTGLDARGKAGHPELDGVTFERGTPALGQKTADLAGEMCQVLNDHWGYAAADCNYKSVGELIRNLIDCRGAGCNFLLNTGPRGNGLVNPADRCLLREFGKWVHRNAEAVYGVRPCPAKAENAVLLEGEKALYAVVREVPVSGDPNVVLGEKESRVILDPALRIQSARWLDSGEEIEVADNSFAVRPFDYGTSLCARVARLEV